MKDVVCSITDVVLICQDLVEYLPLFCKAIVAYFFNFGNWLFGNDI